MLKKNLDKKMLSLLILKFCEQNKCHLFKN